MRERVIQGFFVGGRMHAAPGVVRGAAPAAKSVPVQRRAITGPPPPAHAAAAQVAQRHGAGNESFEVDSTRLGLNRGGGSPLPQALLAKMEAAFGADFSGVRVHVGPQAARIGAVAFTTGNDLYFAPGQYQPQSMQGQQLIGHELAHVIQQRQGRVRAGGSGVSVVQDRALEAEADRLGMRAAAHVMAVQRKVAPSGGGQVRVSAPVPDGAGGYRLDAQIGGRNVGSVMVHVGGGATALVTDLGVDTAHRSQGVGKALLASAAQTGMRFGKARVALTADDNGSGKLNRWYGGLGFARAGNDARGRPRMEAQAGRILAGAVQRHIVAETNAERAIALSLGSRIAAPSLRAIQRMMSAGPALDPPAYSGTLNGNRITWRRRLWEHFQMSTFTVDQFCDYVGTFGTINTRGGQLGLLAELRTAGALFPPILEVVREGLVLSFDATQAQQAPVRVAPTLTNRQAFGMTNPPHNHLNMIDLWAAHANTPPPQGRDEREHYMSPTRNYRISGNDGQAVIDPSTGSQQLEQGHSNLVMGHNPSASTYVNTTGHMHSPGTNRRHNYSPSAYGQIENARASAASGAHEPRYDSPSPTRGSWEGYYLSDHDRFQPAYRELWPTHIRRSCICGNTMDHEAATVCSRCGRVY